MSGLATWQAVVAFLTPTAVFAILLGLHVVLPARRVDGYARVTPNRYRLNGLAVFICALVIWWLELTLAPLDWLWIAKWHALAGAVALSVVLTVWMVRRAPADDRSLLVQWIEGRSRNVHFRGDVDAKMFMYIFGGTFLALNAVSSATYHYGVYGQAANVGLFLHSAMWVWFVADYFCFGARSAVHLRHHRGTRRLQAHRRLHCRLSLPVSDRSLGNGRAGETRHRSVMGPAVARRIGGGVPPRLAHLCHPIL